MRWPITWGSRTWSRSGKKAHRSKGFIKYVLSNPECFDGEDDLLEKIENLVRDRGWSRNHSRNLVVTEILTYGPLVYQDHTGSHTMKVWNAKIENRRPDVAAVRTVCVLDEIKSQGQSLPSPDRGYLKWSGQKTYENNILPEDFAEITLCCTHQDEAGLFLVSARDVVPRSPILRDNGLYLLSFKVYSEGFPLLRFAVEFNLQWQRPALSVWDSSTAAVKQKRLVEDSPFVG